MKTVLLSLCLLFSAALSAQNFNLLYEDAQGDPSQLGVRDIKSVSYAIDEVADSLWFKIEYYNSIAGDLGVAFGIDTDLIADNGLDWTSANNSSLKPDIVFTVNRNFIDPSIFYGNSTTTLLYRSREGANDSILITNMTLSQLDDDGVFNFVVGSGNFDIDINNRMVYDDAPENTYMSVDVTTAVSKVPSQQSTFSISPSPAQTQAQLSFSKQGMHQVIFYDTQGRVFHQMKTAEQHPSIHCSDWPSGLYFIQVVGAEGGWQKWIKS